MIEQLENFLTLAQFMNFTKAADYLYISQSTLSRRITSLEERLGVKLFVRDNRSVQLTEAGKVLLREGDVLIKKIEEVKEKTKRAGMGISGSLSLASLNFYYQPLFNLYKTFCATYPGIAFLMLYRPTGGIIDTIASGKADVGITFSYEIENDLPDFESLCLYKEDFCVIVPLEHRLASRRSVSLSALRGERILFLNHLSYEFLKRFDKYTDFDARDPVGALQSDSLESLLLRVKAGIGVAVVPRPFAVENAFGYSVLEIDDADSSFEVVMLWKRNNTNPSLHVFKNITYSYGVPYCQAGVAGLEAAVG